MAYRSPINVNSISRSFVSLGQGLNNARKTVANITRTISKDTENKKRAISSDSLLFQRKRENIRRKKQRSILELSGVGAALRAPSRVIQNTSRSIFGRMLSFAGTILAGWLIYNLPTITGMAQELIARVKRLTVILSSFLPNTGRILNEFKDLFGAYATNFITFDFFDTSGRVKKEMDELSRAFLDMNGSFEEALKLITTPLTEGVESGQEIPPFGTDYSQTPGSSGGGGSGAGRWKPLFDAIGAGEGSYTSMYPGENHPQILNMTIAEVIEFQKQKMKDGRASGAIGRYQMLYPETYAAAAGLPLTAKFSPENQDKMAAAYIEKNRGGNDWLSGKITDEQFGYLLAKEFAGLKQPNGVGFYDNDGRNKATVDWAVTKAALKKVKSTPTPAPTTSRPTPTPSPTPPQPTGRLIPQTGPGGFIQGGSGSYGETTFATHFHIDLKTPNYTAEGLAKIRDIAFQAIKAMQARGSYVTFGNISGYPVASKNDSVLRSQILQEQQGHDARSSPGVDIQEHNTNIQRTFPQQPGSKTTFPFAVGAVYWRGGYGREAEILGSGGVTVSHGAPGSTASQVPQQVSSTRLSSTQVSSVPRPTSTTVAAAPERTGPTVIVTPQMQQPQMVASAAPSGGGSGSMIQMPVNNIMSNRLLTELAYT